MISVSEFLNAVQKNAARIRSYRQPGDGSDGTSDCIGLIIGALRLAGVQYSGIHGSNYFARECTRGVFNVLESSDLQPGDIVFKAYRPGEKGYALPEKYTPGHKYYNGDLLDYYHVGVVMSAYPLEIWHCSSGGMHHDTSLGRWAYGAELKAVDYAQPKPKEELKPGTAYVDVPNDGTVNVRKNMNIKSTKLTEIREGTPVNVIGIDGEWAKVEIITKVDGYIMKKFLKQEGVDQ